MLLKPVHAFAPDWVKAVGRLLNEHQAFLQHCRNSPGEAEGAWLTQARILSADLPSWSLSGSLVSECGIFFQHNSPLQLPQSLPCITVIPIDIGGQKEFKWYLLKITEALKPSGSHTATRLSRWSSIHKDRKWGKAECNVDSLVKWQKKKTCSVKVRHKSVTKVYRRAQPYHDWLQYSEKQLQPCCTSALGERSASVVAAHLHCNIGSKSSLITARTT